MIEHQSLILDMERYIAGDEAVGDLICSALEAPIRAAARSQLSIDDPDGDDVVQDTLVAMLTYLRRAKVTPDNPEAFAVTITRNRCLNLHLWRRRRTALDVDEMADKLPHIAASSLDLVDEEQRRGLLAETLRSLDDRCRNLLEAIYKEETTVEELRCSLGLNSVQAVYYRRNICIKKAQLFLNRRLFSCRSGSSRKLRRPAFRRHDKESEGE